MTYTIKNLFTCAFICMFCTFMATHYAHMKMPTGERELASQPKLKVTYDSSWKL